MDLKQIEYIVAIEEDGSISKAADRLYLTQSALNQQLLKLEKELGMPLFERKNHQMIPTEAGHIYLKNAHQMLDLKQDTYKKLADLSNEQSGHIRLAYSPERGAMMFANIFPVFHALYPKIRFTVHEQRNRRMEQLLLNREIDLACTTYTDNGKNPAFSYLPGRREEMILGVPISHPLAYLAGENSYDNPPEIDLALFRDTPFVTASAATLSRELEQATFNAACFEPIVLFETSGSNARIQVVKNQIAASFFPAFYMEKDAPMVYFTVPTHPHWTTSVAYRKGRYLSVPELVLADLVRKYNEHKLHI